MVLPSYHKSEVALVGTAAWGGWRIASRRPAVEGSRREVVVADLEALSKAIESGNRGTAVRLTSEAIEQELPPQAILDAMTAAMSEIGGRFQRSEIYVPEMLIAARAMKEATAVLEPVLVQAGIRPEHTAVLGTINGDLHDIGKNLVGMMWRGANLKVIDLGTDVPAERFVEAAREHDADVVGISALLTTTMTGMGEVVAALRAAGLRAMVIVGGAPVTEEYAREIGADGWAPEAGSAATVALDLIASNRS
jgi:5-methyltetrahydrofolate--homocysteine methyltransferase